MNRATWFNRPGQPSIFTPKEGTAQQWRTSAAVTMTRICFCTGRTNRLSTSRSRRSPISKSDSSFKYESNVNVSSASINCSPSTVKSVEYSYDQYHWCPIHFTVNEGSTISSIEYRRAIEGSAMASKINVGTIVHPSSRAVPWTVLSGRL